MPPGRNSVCTLLALWYLSRSGATYKVLVAAQAGDPAMLAGVLRRQRVHLLTELRSLADARATASGSPVVALLVKAAELHVRADLGIVDAAEHDLTPDTLAALRVCAPAAAAPGARADPA